MKIDLSRIRAFWRRGDRDRRVEDLRSRLRSLGVDFHDVELLKRALVHRSYSQDSNERLEFLGDAVISLLVSEYLYSRYPVENEGELTEMRASLVGKRHLADCAERMALKEYLYLGKSEMGLDGRGHESIISDAYEALVGAIYLDRGIGAARRFVEAEILSGVSEILSDERNVNYKSELQHLSQTENWGTPTYRVRAEKGPHHRREFEIGVLIDGRMRGIGHGDSKKLAEQRAARQALKALATTGHLSERTKE
jgi:ribonuclease-3